MHILHGGRGGRDVYFAAVHEFRNIEDPHPVCGDYARGSSESTALVGVNRPCPRSRVFRYTTPGSERGGVGGFFLITLQHASLNI